MRKVVVIDDAELSRRQVVVALERDPSIEVVDDVESLDEALLAVAATRPDVVVLALSVAERAGPRVVALLRTTCPSSRLVVLAVPEADEAAAAALSAGADVVVFRDRVGEVFADALLAAGAG